MFYLLAVITVREDIYCKMPKTDCWPRICLGMWLR